MPLPDNVWGSALERVRPVLRMLARQRLPHRLWHRLDPSDLVQITLQEAHEKRRQFNGTEEEQLLAWLRPILLHRMIDQIKKCQAQRRDARLEVLFDRTTVRLQAELDATGTSPSQALMRSERNHGISKALETLPGEERTVVELHHLQGIRMTELVSVLGISRFAILRRLERGLKKLHKALRGMDES